LPEGITGVFHGRKGSVPLASGLNQISD